MMNTMPCVPEKKNVFPTGTSHAVYIILCGILYFVCVLCLELIYEMFYWTPLVSSAKESNPIMALLVPISIICEQQHLLIRYSFLGIIGILPRSPIMSSCVYNLWVYLCLRL
jgi:hypothetical protein